MDVKRKSRGREERGERGGGEKGDQFTNDISFA